MPESQTTTFARPGDATIAARQALAAGAELLRFEAEGPASWTAFGAVDVCEKLAEALAIACTIRIECDERALMADRAQHTALRDICRDFIAGWEG